MRLASIIDRLDDWINPIVVKELRQAVKSRLVVGILLVFLGLQITLVTSYLLLGKEPSGAVQWTTGRNVFEILQGMLIVTLMLLVPAYACIRLTTERSDHNVDLLFISTLRPSSIIAGKFFAAVMLAMLILSACAPFMTFAYLLRGIDIPTILTAVGIDLLCMLGGTMIALFLAAVPGGRVLKVFFCLAGFIVLIVVCVYLVVGTVELVHQGARFVNSREFWAVAGTITLSTLGWVGLLFFYSVALVSPPSSNRNLPLRLYVLAVWALSGASLLLLPRSSPGGFDMERGLWVWTFMMVCLLGLQLLISLCERDRWGPRVARSIPRWWLRPAAFLLYTGSGGGLVFSVLLLALTLGAGFWWVEAHGPPLHGRGLETWLGIYLIILGYLYCYGLSAVLVRVYLLSGQVRVGLTWIIMLLLVGLGSSIPALVAWGFFEEQFNAQSGALWWKLPSPILVVFECTPSWDGRFDAELVWSTYWFLGAWSLVVSLACLPWFIGQVLRFRPPHKAAQPAVERVEVSVPAAPAPAEAVVPAVNGAATKEARSTHEVLPG